VAHPAEVAASVEAEAVDSEAEEVVASATEVAEAAASEVEEEVASVVEEAEVVIEEVEEEEEAEAVPEVEEVVSAPVPRS
jgi:Ser-tRNA(Ala) deacylase AlaX